MRSLLLGGLLATALIVALVASVGAAAAEAATNTPGEIHTSATEHRSGERLKTIPISKRAWQKPRSVVSLGPARVGNLRSGDRLEAFGEVELSVCLKPNANHGGSGHPCIGKMYSYNPEIKARIVIAAKKGAASPKRTVAISGIERFLCTQKQPNRNHHCVISVPWSGIDIANAGKLPCKPDACRLNLVVSAHHSKAKRRNLLVVGSNNSKGRVKQGKAKLSSVLYRGGKRQPQQSWSSSNRVNRKIPMAAKGAKRSMRVLYSLRLDDLRAGDQLRVDARSLIGIGHLPYNALVRSQLILADGPNSTKHSGRKASKVADSTTRLSAENGFNCTQGGPSGFKSPCLIRKGGILSVKRGNPKPVYLNLIAGVGAQGTAPMRNRWRRSDRARISGGQINAVKYRGSSSCSRCKNTSSHGSIRFSPKNKPPKGSKKRKLVNQLHRWGITQGTMECTKQGKSRRLSCRWSSKGSFGRPYECTSKAEWKRGRWRIKPCKDALGAQLWAVLERRGLDPTHAGGCSKHGQRFVCKWFADGRKADGSKYFCKGKARYSIKRHRWSSIDRCRR